MKSGQRVAISAEMIERAKDLRAQGHSWLECGRAIGVSRECVQTRLDPDYRERRRLAINECRMRRYWETKKPSSIKQEQPTIRPPADVLADAERRRKLVRPTFTSQFFGDPLPGYSALDRRQ